MFEQILGVLLVVPITSFATHRDNTAPQYFVKSEMRALEAATCYERHRGVAISALISGSSPAVSGSGPSTSATLNGHVHSKNLPHPTLQKFKLFKPFKLFDPHRMLESHATSVPRSCLRQAGYPRSGWREGG